MASIILLCNVSRAQLQPQLANNPMKTASGSPRTVCRVTPDAMHNIGSRTRSPTRGWSPHLMLKVPSVLTGCPVFPVFLCRWGTNWFLVAW
eukprot:2379237-Prymnesium_polylepis.1